MEGIMVRPKKWYEGWGKSSTVIKILPHSFATLEHRTLILNSKIDYSKKPDCMFEIIFRIEKFSGGSAHHYTHPLDYKDVFDRKKLSYLVYESFKKSFTYERDLKLIKYIECREPNSVKFVLDWEKPTLQGFNNLLIEETEHLVSVDFKIKPVDCCFIGKFLREQSERKDLYNYQEKCMKEAAQTGRPKLQASILKSITNRIL